MGQEQSSDVARLPTGSTPASSSDAGVQLVRRRSEGPDAAKSKDAVEELLERSRSLPLPQPLLPPPPVKDDVSSALQGAQVMHELRNALGGLLLGIEESTTLPEEAAKEDVKPSDHEETAENNVSTNADAEITVEEGDVLEDQGRRTSSIDEFSRAIESDPRAEQERWARLGIDQTSVDAMLEQCVGGTHLASALDRQAYLLQLIVMVKEKSAQLRQAMDQSNEEARRTTKALDKLDRIHVSLADVQENLESAVATANILGASHFADDDEMCSFKSFLRHNPPKIP